MAKKMGFVDTRRLFTVSLWLMSAVCAGCAGKPIWLDVVALNPAVREKWQADEQFGPTFYAKRDELREIREAVTGMTAVQQDQLAYQLSELMRQEPNDLLRREAVLTLGFLSASSAVPALQAALTDTDPNVRAGACHAWGRRGGPDAQAALAEIVGSDEDIDVRMAAVSELSRFRGQVVFDALSIALEDTDPALQYSAVQSLREVGDRDYGNNTVAWREFLRGGNPPLPQPTLVERMTNWF
jgi:HEAT repeat protein